MPRSAEVEKLEAREAALHTGTLFSCNPIAFDSVSDTLPEPRPHLISSTKEIPLMMRPAGLLVLLCLPSTGLSAATISGEVRSAAGSVAGALVTARSSARAVSWTVPTRADGKFRIEGLDKGDYEVRARHADFNDASMPLALEGDASSLMFVLEPASDRLMQVPSHVFLELLPDGKEKRRLIIDCMGCHPVNQRTMFDKESRLLDEAGWKTATEKMLNFAGANSPFPIMAPDRDAASTAAFVAGHLTEAAVTAAAGEKRDFSAPTVEFTVTEYDFPNAMDFPHDLMLDTRGHVLVTGMFTGVIYRLDPSTAEFTNVQIPAPMANPRALDVDAEGNWWILCGMAEKVARYDIASEKWDLFDIGMYGRNGVEHGACGQSSGQVRARHRRNENVHDAVTALRSAPAGCCGGWNRLDTRVCRRQAGAVRPEGGIVR
jgi:hypothetical protein